MYNNKKNGLSLNINNEPSLIFTEICGVEKWEWRKCWGLALSEGLELMQGHRTEGVQGFHSFTWLDGLLSGCELAYPGEQVQHWFGFLETEDKACERGKGEIQHELHVQM